MKAFDNVVITAMQWAAQQLEADPKSTRARVIDEAARKFGLSPLQTEIMYQNLKKPAA